MIVLLKYLQNTAIPEKIICDEVFHKGNPYWTLAAFDLGDSYYFKALGDSRIWLELSWQSSNNIFDLLFLLSKVFLVIFLGMLALEVFTILTEGKIFFFRPDNIYVILFPLAVYLFLSYLFNNNQRYICKI